MEKNNKNLRLVGIQAQIQIGNPPFLEYIPSANFSHVKFTKDVNIKVSSILCTYFTREGSHYVILCVRACVCMSEFSAILY